MILDQVEEGDFFVTKSFLIDVLRCLVTAVYNEEVCKEFDDELKSKGLVSYY